MNLAPVLEGLGTIDVAVPLAAFAGAADRRFGFAAGPAARRRPGEERIGVGADALAPARQSGIEASAPVRSEKDAQQEHEATGDDRGGEDFFEHKAARRGRCARASRW
jgi:hypothetical protein